MQKVLFSFHAAQRMQQRLNTPISTSQEVNISSAFRKNKTYQHTNGRMVEAWYCIVPDTQIVMVIDQISRVVMTVMTDGAVVDAVYYQAMH